ncbi:hypothetical protein APA22_40650 (plasmid) [Acetobacter pasteurianus IFO 3283-22]|uniref:Uncharacterized protein n=1 Tax=Acetobacter pasteurianus (strain NBRC 105184 / IFO 3283-01) TaxID=634452 RepID=C7JIC5_ACEP3|nr:hypothetical protein APA01_40650 [Acetobacter pasteurianus IFO 3283-01]BAI03900.1 hypothetical protein APA03_40650 [Acetobacter pasteurianus IFO 3283-03]BAI06947.1 hypothetical protein APA07_40650 [Acetobacter pasteurianus IFO 3283-07]BAI09995.1 hypothetical protein APA22_40650 [Acetobacter pasteurianus IFO 3283-22]BAI13043.1 hypothetical protein APA26_40650 [Acetobacter pasteurianus IFO 3283-26]BAI16089.1 hypothetical protein APA32_40650 [Acetobacter pasteurianus IFO 3283-32]BAI19073.1 hy
MSDEWEYLPRRDADPQDKRPLWQEKTCNFTGYVGEKLSPNSFSSDIPIRECILCLQASRKRGLSRFRGKLCHGSLFLLALTDGSRRTWGMAIVILGSLNAPYLPFIGKFDANECLWLALLKRARHATECTLMMRPTTRA